VRFNRGLIPIRREKPSVCEKSLAEEVISYPRDLDDHVRLYGMKADEFEYTSDLCPICGNRIDSLALCGHGNIGGD
jgi:hypothetical protein